jgi:hypothetical protein
MIARQIANGLYVIPVGSVNIILLDYPHGCVLIDACFPGSEDKILVAWGSQESGQKVSVVLNHLRWLPALPPVSLSVSSVRGLNEDLRQTGIGRRSIRSGQAVMP